MATRRTFIGSATAVGAAALVGSATEASFAADGPPGADPAQAQSQARDAIRAVNADMRRNYAALKSELIKHLGPVIIVQNDAKGGKYFLVHHGETISEQPVSEIFELAKSIAHISLGIFSVLAPYLNKRVPAQHTDDIDPHDLEMVAFKGPETDGWVQPLQDFAATITTARKKLEAANLPAKLQASSTHILDGALKFIDDATKRRSFDMKSYEDFSGGVYGDIRTNMYHAAKVQIAGVKDIMTRWKAKVGDKAWPGLYVVVLSIWTTSVLNQNSIIIKNHMDQDQVGTHLIDLSTAQLPDDPVFIALDNLARIVQDNIAAEMVFPVDQEIADALKGKQDLLSTEIEDQLGAGAGAAVAGGVADQAACPFHKKSAQRATARLNA
ncbi:hypothetical protein AQI88_26530 [Streptomyces cellostaticus]|uniref:Tat pathway signal protein n=1 Tax=Streptomyces cellostaticus TaxID=67285 RepID=A0A101NHQ0_9ACTN|nr:hypothetical protein [Streptomyces cellostaticus]KUM93340.1 hypothetical protein AQI88_26530 [Streptomyces cellostaticus]GHI02323.1 hypothetical protein Scel_06440 [Streptomyces cellostaticus]